MARKRIGRIGCTNQAAGYADADGSIRIHVLVLTQQFQEGNASSGLIQLQEGDVMRVGRKERAAERF